MLRKLLAGLGREAYMHMLQQRIKLRTVNIVQLLQIFFNKQFSLFQGNEDCLESVPI